MCRFLRRKIKDKRGGVYLEFSFVLIMFMIIIAIIVAIMPIFAYIHKINVYANNVARVISVEGGLTSEAVYRIEEYREKMQLQDLSPDYSKSDFFDGYKVQLNNEIVVDIKTDYNFKIIGIPVNIPVTVCAVSRSEVYYK